MKSLTLRKIQIGDSITATFGCLDDLQKLLIHENTKAQNAFDRQFAAAFFNIMLSLKSLEGAVDIEGKPIKLVFDGDRLSMGCVATLLCVLPTAEKQTLIQTAFELIHFWQPEFKDMPLPVKFLASGMN